MGSMGGGGSSSSTPQYTPQQQAMQGDLQHWGRGIFDASGGTGQFDQNLVNQLYAPSQGQRDAASWATGQMGNQFVGSAGGMNPWMQHMDRTIANNPAVQGMPPPSAAGIAYGDIVGAMPTAAGGTISAHNMGELQGFAPEAFSSDRMLQAAQNNMQRVISPQLQQAMAAGGSNPMSGAYAEAMANAAAGMALPITQQISGQQYGATMPQLQASMGSQLQQQAAQQGLQSQGYGGGIQGLLNQQNAQNQLIGQGYGGQLQGLLNQGQNMFNAGMAIPGMQGQFLQNIAGTGTAQQQFQGLDRNARLQALQANQDQANRIMSLFGGQAFLNPGQQSNQSNSPNWMQGLFGMGAAAIPGLFGLCWIADALYGPDSEEAGAARAWVNEGWEGEEADEFRRWYFVHGPSVAESLKGDPVFKKAHGAQYRELFDGFVAKGREYLDACGCTA